MSRKPKPSNTPKGARRDTRFSGFTRGTLQFLKNLSANNSKGWFESHRDAYERELIGPLKALVAELGPFMLDIDPEFEVTPAINKTISRIYRDTRFSRDKSLFRDNMWIAFKRPGMDWKECPTYFFEIFSDWYRYGMGFYSATPQTMSNLRRIIISDPDQFRPLAFAHRRQKTFELRGEEYKRLMKERVPAEFEPWYRKRNIYLIRDCKVGKRLFSSQLAGELKGGFGALADLYHFFWRVKLYE